MKLGKKVYLNTLFISEMRFPEGNAAGVLRLRNIATMFKEFGDSVFVIAKGVYTGKSIKNIDGISYISLRSKGNNYISRAFDLYSFYFRVKKFLDESKTKWDKIVIYTVSNRVTEFVKSYSVKHNIKLIIDCDEWYSPEEFAKGEFDKDYQANNKLITKIIDENFSVIAISSYLKNYFVGKGLKTVRIPVTKGSSNDTMFMGVTTPSDKCFCGEIIISHGVTPIFIFLF